jgi:two-component system CheB/CheR fusion protein
MVLDRTLTVTAWNRRSEGLWGLRSEEVVGQNVFTLDIGLPVEGLRPLIQQCLTGATGAIAADGRVIEAINRRGARIECRVSGTALLGSDRVVHGVILVIQEVRP